MRILQRDEFTERTPPSVEAAPAVRVLACVGQPPLRHAVRELLQTQPGISLVGTAESASEEVIRRHARAVDMVIVDQLPAPPAPAVELLFLAADGSRRRSILSAINYGVKAVLTPEAVDAELVAAVRAVAAGQAFLSVAYTRQVFDWLSVRLPERISDASRRAGLLSAREWEVLSMLGQGHSNSATARLLGISTATVRSHISHISSKLDLGTRDEIALFGYQMSVFGSPVPPF